MVVLLQQPQMYPGEVGRQQQKVVGLEQEVVDQAEEVGDRQLLVAEVAQAGQQEQSVADHDSCPALLG